MSPYGGNQPPQQWASGYQGMSVADAPVDTRADFIRKTYLHLAAAVIAFIGIELALFAAIPEQSRLSIVGLMMGSYFSWMLIVFAFIGIGFVADRMARSPAGRPMHYAGLGIYVLAWSILTFPMLVVASVYAPANTVPTAALVTTIIFAALTAFAFITRSDFSWLGGILSICIGAAFAVFIAGWIFGFSLGLWFIVPMILVASGYILYYTSALLHQYQPGQHVAAALALFSSIALLFWYVLQLLMSLQRD